MLTIENDLQEDKLDLWAAFCQKCFSEKDNPPDAAFFKGKVVADTAFRPDQVLCGFVKGQLVATLRVFEREIVWNCPKGEIMQSKAGGIGEVCCDANFRRRGFSKELMARCLDYLEGESYQVSFLHASAGGAQKLYRSLGYESVPTKKCVLSLSQDKLRCIQKLVNMDSSFVSRSSNLHIIETYQMCQRIYDESHRFPGNVLRSDLYWKNWMPSVWPSPRKCNPRVFILQDKDLKSVAYIYLYDREGRTIVGEYACMKETSYKMALLALLLNSAGQSIVCPEPILRKAALIQDVEESLFSPTEYLLECDQGWMYRNIGSTLDPIASDIKDHVVWSADDF